MMSIPPDALMDESRAAAAQRPHFLLQPREWLLAIFLFLLVLVVYLPVLHGGFLLDDDLLLTNNPLIKDPQGWWKFWVTTSTPDYLPLMSDSFWVEWRLWGMNPAGYHATNIALHGVGAALLWRLLRRLNCPGAYLAAALFTVHPVAARSVAWIAERKNTLSLVFFLATLLAYVAWRNTARRGSYAVSLALFAAALLAKSSVVILPLVLLLIALLENRRIILRDIKEAAPFAGLALIFSATTVWYQVHGSIIPLKVVPDPLMYRIASAGYSFWFYAEKVIWPSHLAMIYPKWQISTTDGRSYLPTLLMLIAAVAAIAGSTGRARSICITYLYYLVCLLPVLGFFPMAFFASSMVSDHLQYLAMIGPIALFSAGAAQLWARFGESTAAKTGWATAAVCLVAVLGFMTFVQAAVYKDRVSLALDTLRTNPDSFWAHGEVANSLMTKGLNDQAAEEFRQVIRLRPTSAPAWNNLGLVELRMGKPVTAEADFRSAVQAEQTYWIAWHNLGDLLSSRGDIQGAILAYGNAVRLRPDDLTARQRESLLRTKLGA